MILNKKMNFFILTILAVGLIYRLFISSNGNFIFNMDNARDMVDVREMVILKHLRLIGPTTSVDGVFYGPAWYYIQSVPFIFSGGNPYASILMEIMFWAIGGYFLLTLVNKNYGMLSTFAVGLIWIASNFILLGSQYAFNPNPILFLTPVFIWSLLKFSETKKMFYQVMAFFLGGLFLQFSVPVGIFTTVVIVIYSGFTEGLKFFKTRAFFLGVLSFIATLVPQFVFDLRHGFPMTQALLEYRSTSHGQIITDPALRFPQILKSFYSVLLPTFQNFELFTKIIIIGFILSLLRILRKEKIFDDKLTLLCILLVAVPLIGFIPLKVDLLGWYFNASIVASIFLVGFVLKTLQNVKVMGNIGAYTLVAILFINTTQNIKNYVLDAQNSNSNNSILRNELSAIDYTYKEANGKNFKVYVYMPSVIDYPYQYLYWWHGTNKYGYLPEDYAYLPNVPEYIKQKEKFSASTDDLRKREDSNLIFLIKEPDQIGQRHLWENSFKNLPTLSTKNFGSIIVETRKEK